MSFGPYEQALVEWHINYFFYQGIATSSVDFFCLVPFLSFCLSLDD
jgi:hypothetical protein